MGDAPAAVGIVGFGRIGRIHAQALAFVDGVRLVGVADPAVGAADVGVPAFPSVDELLDEVHVDRLLVATPTPAHAETVRAVRRRWSGSITVEKPVATTGADVDHLLRDPAIDIVYHAAFAPEVSWAVERLPRWRATHGGIVHVGMAFADPYKGDLARASATLGDSWLDGGINALSVLARFVLPLGVASRREVPATASTFETVVRYRDGSEGTASILTTWAATEPSKSTRLLLADGTVVVLDHQAVTGRLEQADGGLEWFDSASPHPRLVQHYVGCFHRLFSEKQRCFPLPTDGLLHRLLLEPPG
jgi:hypothetical protein